MTEAETFGGAHAVVRDARNTCHDPEKRDYLEQLRGALWERARIAQRVEALPLVFAASMPGYITIGRQGDAHTYPDPGLAGLSDAWRIFSHGLTVGHTLNASDLGGTSNALRNRLTKAAEWVERATGCRELARAVRSISINNDGRIDFGQHMKIDLF